MSNQHEELFIKHFIHRHRQHRWKEMFDDGNEGSVLHRLAHNYSTEIDPKYVLPIPKNEQSPDKIEKALRRYGKIDICWAMSEHDDHNKKSLPLKDALKDALEQGFVVIVSCIPGKLCFYQAEYAEQKYIIFRE